MEKDLPTGSGKISKTLRNHETELKRLQPVQSKDMLTTQTTRGVTRTQPRRRPQARDPQLEVSGGAARWA